MASFTQNNNFQFHFINHSNTLMVYDLKFAAGHPEINGEVNPGQRVDSQSFYLAESLEEGNVPVIDFNNAYIPTFRFWSGTGGQYINALAQNGYRGTKDTSEISEITGNGFRITVDGGGVFDPTTTDIYIQVYNA